MKLDEIRSGDLVYWRGTGFWAWLVRFWTRPKFWSLQLAPFFHVGVAWKNGASLFFTDASRSGVRVLFYQIDPPTHAQHTHSSWTPQALAFMQASQGKPYSYKTAFTVPFKIVGKGSSAFMCSEYACRLLEEMGWNWNNYHPTPEGLRLGIKFSTGYDAEVIE